MAASLRFTPGGLCLPAASPQFLLLLLLPGALHAALSPHCPCSASPPRSEASALLEEHLTSTTTRAAEMSCCGRHLLAAHDPQHHPNHTFSIEWSFKGAEYKVVNGKAQVWSRDYSTFRAAYCGLETLESDGLRVGDDGVYSCRVTSSSGVTVTKNFSLCLNINEDTGRPPINSSISEDTRALLREEVTFNCSAYVGRPRCGHTNKSHLMWTKEFTAGLWVEAGSLPHTDVTVSTTEEGMLHSSLTVKSVERKHFGRYHCTVTNHNGNLTLQVTLTKGVVAIVRVTGEYRAALVIMVAAVAFLVAMALLWRRCQMAFALHFRHKAALSTEFHQRDVFLVHGDSASCWVLSMLLPVLEDTYGYTCFLPQRDMCGGDMIIEETAASVWGSRCVLVVVTPCLLDNPWAAWALHHALKASLQARTRLLALVLQDLKPQKEPPDASGTLDILRHIRKLPVPQACMCVEAQLKEESLTTTQHHQEDEWTRGSGNNLEGLRVDTTVCRSRSKSPKNQKVTNMIVGSNMASRDASVESKKRKKAGSTIFLERKSSEEPSSPCSETPFILPSPEPGGKRGSAAPRKKKTSWLRSYLKVLCVRDQKEVFWHTLVGWLGPPAAAALQGDRPHLHEKMPDDGEMFSPKQSRNNY